MLIPQYSLRWLLGATTVCAMACSVFAMALRGSLLAAAVSMAIVALVAIELVHVFLFLLVWLFSLAFSSPKSKPAAGAEQAILVALVLAVLSAGGGAPIATAQAARTVATAGGAAAARPGGPALPLIGNGLRMGIDFESTATRPGYQPVRITVLPTAPVTADRTLSIEILRGRPPTEGYDLRVVRDLEIPAGSTGRTMTISVPEVAGSTHYRVNVSEDGTLLGALSVPWTARDSVWIEALPAMLFLGKSPPDTSGLAAALPHANLRYWATGRSRSGSSSSQLAAAESWPMADFSDQWIDYSGFDIVCLSQEQLAALGESRPAALRALAAWTAAGGNLWVYGVGEQWEHLPELEKILDLLSDRGPTGPAPPGWTAPEKGLYGRTPEAAETSEDDDEGNPVIYRNGRRVAARPAKRSPAGPKTPLPTPPQRPSFVFRPMQAGLVVALASEQPFPGTAGDWRWVLDSMGDSRWHWYERHGLSLKRENPDYWNFLIPGVGVAPVTQFCVLITVFVIGIGPVNYWLLRRRRQLHLLLLTIPASAAAVTLLLFAYALMADGLDVRVRARSVTQLDQRSGRAVCWTRLSYFAGLTPRGGLRFPADTLVLPLEQMPGGISREQPLFREVLWDEDQRFSSGWIAARTPAQFLTVRTRMSGIGLDLLEAPGKEKAPAVRNRLQTPIQQLLVRTKEGKYYRAGAIGVDATAALEPISAPAEAGVLEMIQRDKLLAPPGAEQVATGGGFGPRRGLFGRMTFYPESLPDPAVATSRLEQMRSSGAGQPGDPSLVVPGSYVAVVERSPEVVLGVPSPREEPSSHVILGQW